MTYTCFGVSDVGLVRPNNEDAWAVDAERGFFLVADGLGGHQGGEIASWETVDFLVAWLSGFSGGDEVIEERQQQLIDGITEANQLVYEKAQHAPALRGMGATLCCLWFCGEKALLAHAGDSRTYRLREGRLEQLTRDHVVEGQAARLLTRAVGNRDELQPEVCCLDLAQGDTYLLCSDGLTDMVSARTIEAILNRPDPLQERIEQLVETAKRSGGSDNITVVGVSL